ncbi:glycosyltransferase family 2 protein [Limosilactobacillus reuteri]|uniref:glycosyltransferase family 2 protein n=1 Tax=Limosilactobacillus reuteri TaxID=1598 RepID=UPI00117DAAD0|nr:glycosyltransferase family 2 protein [Limosilactobacillus reuteri]MCC4346850.1 glycosyltransferase [Limosilactobacillus reuteri]MCT3203229.1 glycosyltransferase family 2 protein [Limosilactobacillus reuteri]MCT3211834.1 glycosyltransferase family 2 protein [Limosilactobacillus reuteri]TSB18834.1 glycosyltransferase family 2 protein [Limosilactobacillus reuteri]UAW61710.1 glycosyltransferase [Limosilactobacillus reuteri]
MNKKISVSIIVPIYNVQNWLQRCLNSILKQSFIDFEVLLIDDGSSDGSDIICKRFVKIDQRFKYFRKENGGLSDARNYGIENASGSYLIFIDSDDYIDGDFVRKLYSEIINTNAEVAICGFYRVKENGEKIDEIKLQNVKNNIITGKEAIKISFDDKNKGWALACAWNKIYKRELFDSIRFEKGRYYEDGLIFPFLFINLKRVTIIHTPLYYYVQRNNSIMHSEINIKKLTDDNYSMLKWIKFLRKYDSSLYEMAISKYKNWIVNKCIVNKKLISDNNLSNYFQEQYRICVRKSQVKNVKSLTKDLIGYIDINLLGILFKLKFFLRNNKVVRPYVTKNKKNS